MSIAIKAENLSKAYQIGQIGTGTISRDLERWWITKVMRKEDPFLKVGETNDRTKRGESDIVWSLKDINFEIRQGEAVGIIGRNGAGKSTLLKLLSRVTAPTSGKIKLKGRVASLLEVGTGFHPELTGRENIYLNGSILGMRKKEIARKFDEIVDFSGVERYIDTPVKRYSSGMYVRLAFAVAAHLESEILIVDEVLAVGDAEFQRKCLGKMDEISKGDGRTILLVSHNLASIQSVCESAILLENGKILAQGNSEDVVSTYRTNKSRANSLIGFRSDRNGSGEIKFENIILNENHPVVCGEKLSVELTISVKTSIRSCRFALTFCDDRDVNLFTVDTNSQGVEIGMLNENTHQLKIEIPSLFLMPGFYQINLWVGSGNKTIDKLVSAVNFQVHENDFYGYGVALEPRKHGIVYAPICNWYLEETKNKNLSSVN